MSRLILPNVIVETPYSINHVLHEHFNIDKINSLFSRPEIDILKWMAERHLIKNKMYCDNCYHYMDLGRDKSRKLGYKWKCKTCKRSRSVFSNSYFEDIRLNLRVYFRMIYMWASNNLQSEIVDEMGVDKNTVCDFAKDLREVCFVRCMEFEEMLGGIGEDGESLIVEIDESLFFKRKYNRGRIRNQQWVLGMIERISGKCILIPVPDRSTNTLLEIIRRYVRPGSTIITDGWAAYNELDNDPSYIHYRVIHDYNFVDPEDDMIHTQNIEGTWAHAKRKLRMQHGTEPEYLEGYLFEYMFRRRFRSARTFNEILYSIAMFY